jgi:hypothetical protein
MAIWRVPPSFSAIILALKPSGVLIPAFSVDGAGVEVLSAVFFESLLLFQAVINIIPAIATTGSMERNNLRFFMVKINGYQIK